MNFTLRQIGIFLAVARHENVSRAAQELNLSQSAASAALQTLEQNYGMTLFERHGNRLTLNSIGSSLRKEAETLYAHCQQFDQILRQHGDLGHLKVGASFTIGNYLVVRYLADYLAHYPDADVDFATSNTPDIVNQVLNYEVDVGMIEREVHHQDLELIPWMEDELIVFCAADHPLADKGTLSSRDIRNARWILREPNSGARHTFDHAMAELLPELNIVREFHHNEAIKSAVESGLGIGCLSQVVVQNDFRTGNLVPLKLARRDMRRRFYFALPRKRHPKAAVNYWIELCRSSQLSE
ncbi:DNA-binding transcriptional LysR family regulator [Litorivivens lipolytica]|uniref:DNA-binding transcriptional LysR family regulator n=1 Tax=Litorivivens lipolytica TaxID=1524264 RepID=A0A7W4W2F7_9GAMM|nr:LysR family transcriptional regulator [Litorivivens lipolytica]MBB3045913.1 DNA-binding transcriptional LysR family regulator [Litorivivens lipolytica]